MGAGVITHACYVCLSYIESRKLYSERSKYCPKPLSLPLCKCPACTDLFTTIHIHYVYALHPLPLLHAVMHVLPNTNVVTSFSCA